MGAVDRRGAMLNIDIPGVGVRIGALRRERGWSIRELSRLSGVSHAHIAQIEAGRVREPSILKLASLAAVLGLTLDGLLQPTASGAAASTLEAAKHGAARGRPSQGARVAGMIPQLSEDLRAIEEMSPEDLALVADVIRMVRVRAERQGEGSL